MAANTILTRYTDNVEFSELLDRIGLGTNKRSQFDTDRFTNVFLLVNISHTMLQHLKCYLTIPTRWPTPELFWVFVYKQPILLMTFGILF